MKIALTIMLILFFLLIGAGFYYYYFQLLPMKAEFQVLSTENQKLKQEILSWSKISEEKAQKIEAVTSTYQNLIEDMKDEIKSGEIKISELAGKLKVNIVDKILFDSGESALSPRGEKILARLGKILKQDTSKIIRVEGHTDNVKIHRRLKGKFPTNWELSTSRATNVVRLLQEKLQIDGRLLEVAGYAEYRPVASNKSVKGRAQNRRIEILFVPK